MHYRNAIDLDYPPWTTIPRTKKLIRIMVSKFYFATPSVSEKLYAYNNSVLGISHIQCQT